ncbi:hypothetical protein K9L16_01500 [Candidatus Pacearchaeota archaeon]|nr:hypothetical protein [Candidatus Pacearchaeota archaeon]
MNNPNLKKRGQVTIFIIAGIAVVLGIVFTLFFLGGRDAILNYHEDETNPNSFMENCLSESLENILNKISKQGGYVTPMRIKKFQFSDEKEMQNLTYLCYNQNYYLPCINQEPMLIQHLKKEIKKNIEQETRNCFIELVTNYENSGYTTQARYNDFEVELKNNLILINIDSEITTTLAGETNKINSLKAVFNSKLYNLAAHTQEILFQEAKNCNFDQLSYMTIHKDTEIEKIRTSDSEIIYRLIDKKTNEEFRFVVRGCVIPAGV